MAVGLFDFAKFTEEVPELGLGLDGVWGEDLHSVDLGVWVLFCWDVSTHDLCSDKKGGGEERLFVWMCRRERERRQDDVCAKSD